VIERAAAPDGARLGPADGSGVVSPPKFVVPLPQNHGGRDARVTAP
jgi:hypothetical protein